jgi:hypothetical protein
VPDDLLAAAVAELYGAAPEAFTARRGELVAAARGAGDLAAAKAIAALRRPSRAAWVVNRLVRADPSAPGKLAELAGALRAAEQARHGPRLRELSAGRGALVDALTAQALAVAGVPDPPPSLRSEVADTLTAALADPQVAAAFATGTLTRAAQWSGFGDAAHGSPARGRDTLASETAKAAGGARSARSGAGLAEPEAAARPQEEARWLAEETRQEKEAGRLAREAAERAARRREQSEGSERLVVATSTAAAEAASAEDDLEAEVRDLEQRLTQARADLAAARMRARHAEAAERRARQALDRLPRE